MSTPDQTFSQLIGFFLLGWTLGGSPGIFEAPSSARRPAQTEDRMISPAEAAEMLNAKPWPVVLMCERGELASVRIGGRVAIPRSAVTRLIANVAAGK